jgi:hypothetical protein
VRILRNERALVQAQLPSHLRDRPTRLPDDPNRALPEIPIKISPFDRHPFLKGDVSTVRGEAQHSYLAYAAKRGNRPRSGVGV